ncbi:MAG TPA: sugar phosphate isomerase/epimerase family protein [Puia sp.]|jgi:sugar phosphate isomerase/epimerase
MKLSIAIADTHALPSAFVVYRGFDQCIPKAARLGYHGVELALRNAGEINVDKLQRLLQDNRMEVSCISTGQIFADDGLTFTHTEEQKVAAVKTIFRDLIDLAAIFGKTINIGRVRGSIGGRSREITETAFIEVASELCDYASPKGVTLIMEPVNRYEIDFINSVEEGVALVKKINRPNMLVMPDVFHMNIEDVGIGAVLARNISFIKYIHFADSNRLAPGQGHLDFNNIMDNLLAVRYRGWVSVEILPKPDPDTAAGLAAQFLLPRIEAYNSKLARTTVKTV